MSKVISSAIAVLLLFLLLVPAACTVGPSESPDIDKAIDVVVKDVLPTIAEIQAGGPYWCLKLDDPLPSGTIIEEDSGSTLKITLSEEFFFFYVDLAPGSFYAHPVKYILVDKHGEHEVYDAQWWPRIDGVIPQELVKVPPDEEDIVDNNLVEWVSPVGTLAEYVSVAYMYNKWSEGFIVVQGVMIDEALYNASVDTYINVIDFFNAIKNAYSEVVGLIHLEAADVLDLIDIMADEKRSVITIYIIAHGNVNYVRLGGQSFYASLFCNKMAEHPDILFNFVLCSCHSGSFINALSTLPNVRVVLTACADDERAYPDYDNIGGLWWFLGSGEYDINPSDVGSEWTSSLIQAGLEIVVDADKLTTIESMATEFGAPVTSVLLYEAGYGAVGANPGLGLSQDYDLCHRTHYSSPQVYCSFEPLG